MCPASRRLLGELMDPDYDSAAKQAVEAFALYARTISSSSFTWLDKSGSFELPAGTKLYVSFDFAPKPEYVDSIKPLENL